MESVRIDPDGTLRCPHCGATQFANKRTAKAKIGLGLAVGLGALAAPKRLQCLGCREYLRSAEGGAGAPSAGSSLSAEAREANAQTAAGLRPLTAVVITGKGSVGTFGLPKALSGAMPDLPRKELSALAQQVAAGKRAEAAWLYEDEAAALAARLTAAGFAVETRT